VFNIIVDAGRRSDHANRFRASQPSLLYARVGPQQCTPGFHCATATHPDGRPFKPRVVHSFLLEDLCTLIIIVHLQLGIVIPIAGALHYAQTAQLPAAFCKRTNDVRRSQHCPTNGFDDRIQLQSRAIPVVSAPSHHRSRMLVPPRHSHRVL